MVYIKMSKQIIIATQQMFEEISKLIAEGNTVTITAAGYSMNPGIAHMRDQVTLGPWTDGDIRPGTVALVRDLRGNVVLHRIIRRKDNFILLEGDGNIKLQEKATLDGIAGIMHSITRKNRIITSKSLLWRIYSWTWVALRPLRRYPLAIWRRLNPQPPLHK